MPVTKQGLGENQLKAVVVPTHVGRAEHAMPTTTSQDNNHQATMPVEVGEKEVESEQVDIRATSQRTPRRAPSHQTGQLRPTKKGLGTAAIMMIVVGGICLLAVMVAVSISIGVSIGHSRERHQALVDKQIVMMPAPAESEPIIYDAGLPATSAATKPAAAAPSLNPSAPAAPTAQDSVAALEQTFEHTLASGEDASLLERACSLLALKSKAISKLPKNVEELKRSRRLNGVKTNEQLPKSAGKPIQVSCDLESDEGKKALVSAHFRRSQVLGGE